MTIKRAIAIGTLSAITITLIAFGIKTKSFKPKTTTPISYNLNKKRNTPLQVNADDTLDIISTKWVFNESLETNNENTTQPNNFTQTINNKIFYNNSWINNTSLIWDTWYNYVGSSYYAQYGKRLESNGSRYLKLYQYAHTTNTSADFSRKFEKNEYRLIKFDEQPTGDAYSLLKAKAKPVYNGDVIIYQGTNYYNPMRTQIYNTGITEIRKNNVHIEQEDIINGQIINTTGTIQLYLDAGISSLIINGTDYTNNLTSAINITNDDIIIKTTGTKTGETFGVFTINYFNTRPPIEPQPYPDPGDQVVEVIEIMPMMFKILTMPFTFISQAFNVTLWEGTPYQFNFSNFILSLIAIATLLFIIKLFTSGFSIIGNYSANHESRALKRSRTKLNNAKTQQIKNGTKDKPSKKG